MVERKSGGSARSTASSQAVLQIPHRGRSRPRSDGDDPDPQRLGALDHCLVEAKNALRIETPGDRKVKRVARPQLQCVVTGQIGCAAEFLPSGNGYGAMLVREFADPRRG